MSQTVYWIRHLRALVPCRPARIGQTHYEEIDVQVENNATGTAQDLGTINPVNILYGSYQTSTFTTVASGSYTIKFIGVDPLGGDNTVFIDQVTLSANAITDGSFETPALATGAVQFGPASGSPWQFSTTAGVARNGSNFIYGNPNAPGGNEVGIIEGNGSMSQTVNLVAGEYNVSFQATQRANGQTHNQQIEVVIDPGQADSQVRFDRPLRHQLSTLRDVELHGYAGFHTIEFVGTSPQGSTSTALIDEVALAAANDEIIDGGFESPVLAANTYQVAPTAALAVLRSGRRRPQ